MGPGEYLVAGTVAVLLGLDRVAFLQCMVCRPLVAASLTGWLLGILGEGLQVGILLELLWLFFTSPLQRPFRPRVSLTT